ncbi:MAG: DUF4936 family protein [Proteobacteria bacterium]|nr:DUF4936 family protein [Pseudomonadota bacterium]MDE3208840.1 DUF4936 family protein [Pseudomonadota bacterium]
MEDKQQVCHYFIYYTLGARDKDEVFNLTLNLMQKIKEETGISGRLLEKGDIATTWLEIYEGIQDSEAFETVMTLHEKDWHNAYDTMGLERITEKFTELACLFLKS